MEASAFPDALEGRIEEVAGLPLWAADVGTSMGGPVTADGDSSVEGLRWA
jgi:hypothetical protein